MKMSLVVPCYNEEEAIPIFYREALKVIEQLKDEFEFEFCFVDDGSKDGTLQCFKNLRVKDEICVSIFSYMQWIYFFFKKLWKRICIICRITAFNRRLCCNIGCGSAGSTVTAAGNVENN